jgi:hypothetical protein
MKTAVSTYRARLLFEFAKCHRIHGLRG